MKRKRSSIEMACDILLALSLQPDHKMIFTPLMCKVNLTWDSLNNLLAFLENKKLAERLDNKIILTQEGEYLNEHYKFILQNLGLVSTLTLGIDEEKALLVH